MTPSNRWLLWLRWVIVMMIAGVAIPLFMGATRDIAWVQFFAVGLLAVVVLTYQPIRQHVEGSCAGAPVSLTFSMDMLGRLFMHAGGSSQRIMLGRYYGVPLWLEWAIDSAERSERLLIYFRFPNGFLVSHAADSSPLTVTRNEFCL